MTFLGLNAHDAFLLGCCAGAFGMGTLGAFVVAVLRYTKD